MRHVLLLFTLLLISCGTHKLNIVKPPEIDESIGALITIRREDGFSNSAHTQYIILNGQVIADLDKGKTIRFRVPEGEHTIGLKCYGPTFYFDKIMGFSTKDDDGFTELRISPKVGEDICIKSDVAFMTCAVLEMVDKDYCRNPT